MNLRAPAKLNLCLFVGPTRPDGLHELASIFLPLSLSDRLVLVEAEADEVVCPEVPGPNIVAAALEGLRARGWEHPPLRVEIDKRIPVAAGLGGGSADAAALLRYVPESGEAIEGLGGLAAQLGADVPSQLDPRPALVGGCGEVIEAIPAPERFALVLIPQARGLAAGEVYAEADRLGSTRPAAEIAAIGERLRGLLHPGWSAESLGELVVNDLEPAARSLRPEIEDALGALRDAGASHALVSGSGPTAFGTFADVVAADRAAAALPPRFADPIVATVEAAGAGDRLPRQVRGADAG